MDPTFDIHFDPPHLSKSVQCQNIISFIPEFLTSETSGYLWIRQPLRDGPIRLALHIDNHEPVHGTFDWHWLYAAGRTADVRHLIESLFGKLAVH